MELDLDQDYIANGLVRFVYKHFIILGAESQWAAEASECAAEQNAFWAYHDKLFANQSGENKGAFSKDKLEGFARDIGLNMSTFRQCVQAGKYATKVAQDSQEARVRGFRGTPTVIVGETVIPGLVNYTQLKQVIAAELEKARK